ncbi:MAG: VWA domain-containing protein [Gammaproteobacteria bacterium]|nr:VWA domain-containing protein [Gammaproteobacteria bacterium]
MKPLTLSTLIFTAGLVACNQSATVTPPPAADSAAVSDKTVANSAPPPASVSRREIAATEAVAIAPQAKQTSMVMSAIYQEEALPQESFADRFTAAAAGGTMAVSQQPVSTFSIDVDSGSYAVVRRFLNQGQLPPTAAVRSEELINYFDYHYPKSDNSPHPFSITTELGVTPWNSDTHLLHIGIQGKSRVSGNSERPAANLVFLIDVSGSMHSNDKLPLLKAAFRLLCKSLTATDRVTLVVYAGDSGVVLEPTAGDQQATILAAIDKLQAGGSTHGSAGIQLAYEMAAKSYIKGGINRVMLATDGDFNVGTVNHEALLALIEKERQSGISLTTLGFGEVALNGNYHDHLMEQLADHGNGHYAYIDTLQEAQKVLVDELSATLESIANDVKIQVEWNPAQVSSYRLIGYENRQLQQADFNNDRVDAGDIGAGHSVTALYEVTFTDAVRPLIDPLRYATTEKTAEKSSVSSEVAFIKLRYKATYDAASQLIERPVLRQELQSNLASSSDDYRFSAAVAAFAQQLRNELPRSATSNPWSYHDTAQLAKGAKGEDQFGYRQAFLGLIGLAEQLSP